MATTWTPGNLSTVSGTNASVTAYLGYSSASAVTAGDATAGIFPNSSTGSQGTLALRLTVTPTTKVKSVTFSFTHANTVNGYSSIVAYYAKVSTSSSAWPAMTDTGTALSLTAAGTKSVTLTLDSATSSAFYVYIWGYRVNTGYTGQANIKISAVSAVSCAKAAPSVYVKVSGTWTAAAGLYVKAGGSWVEATGLYAKVSGSWTGTG